MNMALIILLGEFFLVMVFFLIGFGIAAWQRKKLINTALEKLIKDVEKRRPERREKLLNRLQNSYGFDDTKAAETSADLLQVENNFLKTFFTIQLTQDSKTIVALGSSLHQLLDRYIDLDPLKEVAVNLEKAPVVENERKSEKIVSEANVSVEDDIEVAIDELGKTESGVEREYPTEPIEANQSEQDISGQSSGENGSTSEQSIDEVLEPTHDVVEQEEDFETVKIVDPSSEVASDEEPQPGEIIDDLAAIKVNDQTESPSEPEPSWDDAFAEIETQEPTTEVDPSTSGNATTTIA